MKMPVMLPHLMVHVLILQVVLVRHSLLLLLLLQLLLLLLLLLHERRRVSLLVPILRSSRGRGLRRAVTLRHCLRERLLLWVTTAVASRRAAIPACGHDALGVSAIPCGAERDREWGRLTAVCSLAIAGAAAAARE